MASVDYNYEFSVDRGGSMNVIVGRVPDATLYTPPVKVRVTYDPALTSSEQMQLDGFMRQQGFLPSTP